MMDKAPGYEGAKKPCEIRETGLERAVVGDVPVSAPKYEDANELEPLFPGATASTVSIDHFAGEE
jgi:hypothetical protein